MKSLPRYIQEKLIIRKNKSSNNYKYFPETKKELQDIILKRIKEEGNEVDLNDINVSKITDMSSLFNGIYFNGDISNWDVSKVKDMSSMFYGCKSFNKDISGWDVKKVKNPESMFSYCHIQVNYKPRFK